MRRWVIVLVAPCYICGKPAVLEGLCAKCYDDEHPLVRVASPLGIQACKRCGSVKVPGGWKTIIPFPSEAQELVRRQIEVLLSQQVEHLVKEVDISFEIEKKLDRVVHILLKARGRSHPSQTLHEEEYPVEVRFSYVSCGTCGMMSGGYHEAILQVRADGREVTEAEEQDIVAIVTRIAVNQYGHDSKAYATEKHRTRSGFDFELGSDHMCRLVADEIQSVYLAERKENYKLIGQEKGGKRKYRVTILVRLPRWTVGDFVKVGERPCQVISIRRSGLTCRNLNDGQQFTIGPKSSNWRSLAFAAPAYERRQYQLLSRAYEQPAQLMDAKTYEIIEIDQGQLDPESVPGDTVFLVNLDNTLYALPRASSLPREMSPD
jgi:nonsense-mediated mRNA decay protein 3